MKSPDISFPNTFLKVDYLCLRQEIFSSNQNDIFLAWFVVGCGIVGAINLAKLAPSMGRLIDYFQISLSTSGLIAGIFSVLMITTGLIGGIIVSKYGPRLAMLLGLFISIIGGMFPVLIPEFKYFDVWSNIRGFWVSSYKSLCTSIAKLAYQ